MFSLSFICVFCAYAMIYFIVELPVWKSSKEKQMFLFVCLQFNNKKEILV